MAHKQKRSAKVVLDMSDLITLSEAADLRGTSVSAVSQLVRRGRLPAVEIFGKKLVRRSDVLSYEPEHGGWPKGKPRKSDK